MDADFGAMSFHTDVWGFAACIMHIYSGQQPYPGLSQVQIVGAILKGRPPAIPSAVPEWLQQSLRQCFSFDATARPSVKQLHQVNHESLKHKQACFAVHVGHTTLHTAFFAQLYSTRHTACAHSVVLCRDARLANACCMMLLCSGSRFWQADATT